MEHIIKANLRMRKDMELDLSRGQTDPNREVLTLTTREMEKEY
jgi:hypothetical protein